MYFVDSVAMIRVYTVADLLVSLCSNDYGDVGAMLYTVVMISDFVAMIWMTVEQ